MKILHNLIEVTKKLKHRKATVKYCPRCGQATLKFSSKFDGWITPIQYICENCGYKGPIAMEKEETTKHKKTGKNKKN
jgi:predicted RNA-binding Zn-ribbon protein involved in translation (DUF1610 family)